MSRLQLSILLLAFLLIAVLYSCPTRPPERTKIDENRQEQATAIDLDKLRLRAQNMYSQEQLSPILALEEQLNSTQIPEEQTEIVKKISSA